MADPYEILGVSKSANQDEIKKSYRKLAKKFHPDLNPGNKEAEKKFKAASHAFDQIGTAETRAKFDGGEAESAFGGGYQNANDSFYQSQQNGGRYSYSFGEDIGGSDFFENLFGSGKGSRSRSSDFPGEDIIYKMEVDFRDAALGGEKNITLPNGKTLQVKIPPGIETGKKLRFKGLGRPGIGNGPAGNALIEIEVKPLQGFKRIGKDIEVEVPISFIEAITGADIKVPTLEGEVLLTVPAGVSTGSKLRVKGKGAGPTNDRGNEIVVLKVVIPKNLDPALKSAIENLKHAHNYNPRMQ
jgi:DnaJ-class molecular chaperone